MNSGSDESLVECVPNVSEGRDAEAIARFAAAVRSVPGVTLMNVHADPDHHRSVLSLLGPPAAVETAVAALAAAVLAAVDMRRHHGIHPRLGALDVVPFVPLAGLTASGVVALAQRVGARLAARHDVPVYYYGWAARRESRRRLPEIRKGEYESLVTRLRTPEGAPDAGPARFDPRTGAVVVGARDILVAYNVWLNTGDLGVARAIARTVRESSGGLPGVQAMGVPLASRGLVQVSMNLLDVAASPLPAVFDRVSAEARRRGVKVRQGELVGVAPRAAFAGRDPASVGLADFTPALLLESYRPTSRAPLRHRAVGGE
jgi:glutamate formiminotransferase